MRFSKKWGKKEENGTCSRAINSLFFSEAVRYALSENAEGNLRSACDLWEVI